MSTAPAATKRGKLDPPASAPNKKAKKETQIISESLSTIPRKNLEDFARTILKEGNYSQEALEILEESYKQCSALEKIMANKDLWINQIFPFLGPGHSLYVSLVCRKFKQNYWSFFSKIKEPPKVYPREEIIGRNDKRPATYKDTFYRNAFSSVPFAEFWNEDTKKENSQLKDRLGRCLVSADIAKHGNLEVLKWAHGNGFPFNKQTCNVAAKNGQLEVLKFLHQKSCPWNSRACEEAALNGHLDCLKYLHNNKCPWSHSTCRGAALGGHLECLMYAHKEGCPWNNGTCYTAAKMGHLQCLKYAHENNCEWDAVTCLMAAQNGHLDCLKYAHEEGCEWDQETCEQAAASGHLDCLVYAHGKGCPFDANEIREITDHKHKNIWKWLNGLNQEDHA